MYPRIPIILISTPVVVEPSSHRSSCSKEHAVQVTKGVRKKWQNGENCMFWGEHSWIPEVCIVVLNDCWISGMFCFSCLPPGEGRKVLLLPYFCFNPFFRLLLAVCWKLSFIFYIPPFSLHCAPVHISSVAEVIAKKGALSCNSHLVSMQRNEGREGREVWGAKNECANATGHQMRWPKFLPPITICVAILPVKQRCENCLHDHPHPITTLRLSLCQEFDVVTSQPACRSSDSVITFLSWVSLSWPYLLRQYS